MGMVFLQLLSDTAEIAEGSRETPLARILKVLPEGV